MSDAKNRYGLDGLLGQFQDQEYENFTKKQKKQPKLHGEPYQAQHQNPETNTDTDYKPSTITSNAPETNSIDWKVQSNQSDTGTIKSKPIRNRRDSENFEPTQIISPIYGEDVDSTKINVNFFPGRVNKKNDKDDDE